MTHINELDIEKLQQYKELLESSYAELHEMALMLSGHKFDVCMRIPKHYRKVIFRQEIQTVFLNTNEISKKERKKFFSTFKLLKEKFEKNNQTLYVNHHIDYYNKDTNQELNNNGFCFYGDDFEDIDDFSEEDPYDFLSQKYFVFLRSPINIVRELCFEGFILPIELQELIGLRQFTRRKKITKPEEKRLRIQATALALFIISDHQIGRDDICSDPIMKKMNEDSYYRKTTQESDTDLTRVKELVSSVILTKQGNKTKLYKEKFLEEWKNHYKLKKCFPVKETTLIKNNLKNFYQSNKPLPNVFDIKDNQKWIDFPRFIIVIKTWRKMYEKKFISQKCFLHLLAFMYFEEAKLELGYMCPYIRPFRIYYEKKDQDCLQKDLLKKYY